MPAAFDVGCIPEWGWEQSGGESMTAVVEIVCPFFERGGAGGKSKRKVGSVVWGAQGLTVRGFDGTGGTWSGWTPSIRHLLRISTPGRVGSRGGVAGAEPPHKGGPTRPDRPKARRERRGVRRENYRFLCLRVDRGRDMAPLLPEGQESSPQYWDAHSMPEVVGSGCVMGDGAIGNSRKGTHRVCHYRWAKQTMRFREGFETVLLRKVGVKR